jgi:hypothetical protein
MDALTVNFLLTLGIAAVIGLLPAAVAERKGRSAVGWWLFGVALAVVAIPMIFIVEDLNTKKCPKCAEKNHRRLRWISRLSQLARPVPKRPLISSAEP